MSRSRQFSWWIMTGLFAVALVAGCQSSGQQTKTDTSVPPEEPADSTVSLVVGRGAVPFDQHLSAGREESVWWQNDDDRGHTIRFTNWPFREPHQDILVEAGHKSKKFHVYKSQPHTRYTYTIRPQVPGDPNANPSETSLSTDDPPDPPGVVTGP